MTVTRFESLLQQVGGAITRIKAAHPEPAHVQDRVPNDQMVTFHKTRAAAWLAQAKEADALARTEMDAGNAELSKALNEWSGRLTTMARHMETSEYKEWLQGRQRYLDAESSTS